MSAIFNALNFERRIQADDYSCGSSSVWMIAASFGVDVSHKYVKELCGTTKEEGTTVAGLIYGLRELGIRCGKRTQINCKQLRCEIDDGSEKVALVHVDGDHYMVVTGFDDKRVYVADPSARRTKGILLSYETFKKRFSKWAIICSQ
jgi:ABC-type bacteriocin/lantibiotic exporter with double-glycine peptidase domain